MEHLATKWTRGGGRMGKGVEVQLEILHHIRLRPRFPHIVVFSTMHRFLDGLCSAEVNATKSRYVWHDRRKRNRPYHAVSFNRLTLGALTWLRYWQVP